MVHQQLPFVAHLMRDTEIYFYVDETSRNQIVKRPDMKFLGAYSVFHTTKSNLGALSELNNSVRIKNAKWVKNLCQMIVQFNNNSIALLSSFT